MKRLFTRQGATRLALAGIFLVTLIGVAFLSKAPVRAAWLSPDWQYRTTVAISSHSSLENNVYIVLPSFDATDSNKFQADCGDLRFSKLTGEILPYYVVACNATAEVHVLFDSLPAGASSFYIYYGNAVASNGFSNSDFSTPATGLGTVTFGSEEFRANPLAYWRFDELNWTGAAAEILDAAGSNNGTALNGATTNAAGQFKRSANFSSSNRAQMPYVDPGNNLTIAAWINPTTYRTGQPVANETHDIFVSADRGGCGNIHGNNPYMFTLLNGVLSYVVAQTMNCTTGYAADFYLSNAPALPIGRYSYVVVTVSNNSAEARTLNFYVNGVDYSYSQQINATTTGAGSGVGFATYIGNKSASYNQGFNGLVDDVKIYDRTLSAQEIQDNYNYGIQVSTGAGNIAGLEIAEERLPTPMLHYKLDEQTGQVVNNSISATYPGVLGANTSAAGDDPVWQNPDLCRVNGCQSFNGNQYADIGSIGDLGTTYSTSLWLKPATVSGSPIMLSYRTDNQPNTNPVGFQLDQNNADLRFIVRNGAGTGMFATAANVLTAGQWVHVLGVRNGNSAKIYVNGVLMQSLSAAVGSVTMNRMVIGAFFNDTSNSIDSLYRYQGNIDEVKVWNVALTDSQARLDYNYNSAVNVGVTGNTEAAGLLGGAGAAPLAEWKLDENQGSLARDTSSNSNDLTLNGDTKWVPGKVGAALQFDGVDDNATVPSSSVLNIGTSDFTIEAWVKGNSMANNDIILAKTDGGGCSAAYGYSLGVFDSLYPTLHFCTSGSAHAKIQGVQTLVDGQWYHIVAAVDRDNVTNTRMYVNGVMVSTTVSNLASHTGSITNTVSLALGSESDNGFNWDGQIDQARIYNYRRSAAQIAYAFDGGGPVTWLKMNEGSSVTVRDYTGRGSDGTMVNMDPGTDWITGENCPFAGACIDLDGSNDRIVLPASDIYNVRNSFSVSVWVKPRTYAACTHPDYTDVVASKSDDSVSGMWYVSVCNGGSSSFATRMNSTTAASVAAPVGSVPLNTWTHIVGTFEGNAVRIYINGRLVNSVAVANLTIPDLNVPVWIGAHNNPSYMYQFNGLVDEIQIYNYAVSASQVASIYNNNSALLYGR